MAPELTHIDVNNPVRCTFQDNTTIYRTFLLRNFRSKIGSFYHQPTGNGISIEFPLIFYILSEGEHTLQLLRTVFNAKDNYPLSLNTTIQLDFPQSFELEDDDGLPLLDPLCPTPKLLSPLLFAMVIGIDQAGCRPPIRKPHFGYVPAVEAMEMMIEYYLDALIDGREGVDHPKLHFDSNFQWR